MSVAAAVRDAQAKPGDLQAYEMGVDKIYKGTLVNGQTDGYVYPARSGTSTDVFVGVAYETVDNAGAAGSEIIQIRKTGAFVFTAAFPAAITDMFTAVYANDDQSVTTTSSNNQLVGYIVEVISAALVRVRIDRAVQ